MLLISSIFFNKVGTQIPSQIGEERRTLVFERTGLVDPRYTSRGGGCLQWHQPANGIRQATSRVDPLQAAPCIFEPSIPASECPRSGRPSAAYLTVIWLVTVIPLLVNVTGD
jgi:hypothetical protein